MHVPAFHIDLLVTAFGMPINICVRAEANAGGRKSMEDYIAVQLRPNSTENIPDMRAQGQAAFVGVFDRHGGKEAARFARENLWEFIQKRQKFSSPDICSVKDSIREGYLDLHDKMHGQRCE